MPAPRHRRPYLGLALPALTLPALTLPARRPACPPCRVPPALKAPASRRRWPTSTGVWSSRAWLAPSGSPRELLLSTAAAVCLGARGGGRRALCGEDAGGCNRVAAGAVGKGGRGRAAAGAGTGGAACRVASHWAPSAGSPSHPPAPPAPLLLCSYIPGDTFAKDSAQYVWLAAELAATDRSIFPWLIVNFHAVSGRAGWWGRCGLCSLLHTS